MITQTTFQPIGGVTSVTLAKLQQDKEGFQRAYLRLQGLASLLTLPAIAGFSALAPEIIHLLFGAKWASAVPVAQILGFLSIPFCVNFLVGPALQSIGASGAMSKLAFFQFLVTAVFSIIGAQYGLTGVAAAYVIRAYLTVPLQLHYLRKFTGIPALAVAKELLFPVTGSLAMIAAVLVARQFVGRDVFSTAALVCLGAVVYAGFMWIAAKPWLTSHIKSVRGAFG